ncbi:MAG: exodeoxyribonuclease III [Bernardetiaceae bacterium]|nr:exodeoxyribonuclease III [Bernardetiaceae bacterium]
MKIISYNINGIRAALGKDFLAWLKGEDCDVLCLQEVKATATQVPLTAFEALGFHHIGWQAATSRKGYSGVAIFSKIKPTQIAYGYAGSEREDSEGRVLRMDFENLSIMNVYMPSGTSGTERQEFKMQWMHDFQAYINTLPQKDKLLICGDYNIAHHPIDIHAPKRNEKNSGFLPEERAWLSEFFETENFIDTFRYLHPELPAHYTWWTFRSKTARLNNKGWRIDYQAIAKPLANKLKAAYMLPDAKHSDHCPTVTVIES